MHKINAIVRAASAKGAVTLSALRNDRKGVTALEYGIIAGVLGLALIGIFTAFGSTLSTLFSNIGGSI